MSEAMREDQDIFMLGEDTRRLWWRFRCEPRNGGKNLVKNEYAQLRSLSQWIAGAASWFGYDWNASDF